MANRYWVGGTGTWDNTGTSWATTDGGAAGSRSEEHTSELQSH